MRGAGGFWWRWLAATALVFGLAWLLLTGLDVGPRPGHLLLLVALGMVVLALVNLSVVSEGPDWSVDTVQPVVAPGQDTRLAMYSRVIGGHLDSRDVDPVLRDRLAALAAVRLRQRHGLGMHDPAAADLLGREVADILTGPPRRLSRAQIEACVRTIEEL
jgi:hypothetical protein